MRSWADDDWVNAVKATAAASAAAPERMCFNSPYSFSQTGVP
jgi:hypothetical protein